MPLPPRQAKLCNFCNYSRPPGICGAGQRRGLRLVRLWPDSVTQARTLLKPEIPLIGDHGIAIRDEIELELPLADPNPAA